MSGLELACAGIEINNRWLVQEISLELKPGSLTALIGPNGSGKSTILRLLAGLWYPTEGMVKLEGLDVHQFSRRDLARRVSFVPQDTHLTFSFTVREAVSMGRHPHLGRFEREKSRDKSAVEGAMRRADILHISQRLVTEISGGERQRVVIARSLATEADVILLDEPTANLDISHALDILSLCRALADEGKTVVLAIHDLNAASRFATTTALLHEGRLVARGPSNDVLTDEWVRRVFGIDAIRVGTPGGETLFWFERPSNDELTR